MKVLVTGASGTLGSAVVPRLVAEGHDVVATSREPRGDDNGVAWRVVDLSTGQGLLRALEGVDTIVHAATAPYKRGYTREVDVGGTGRLVRATHQAGVTHLIYVSIVGVDRIPFGYYRTKVAAERIVRESGLGWTVLRATQFFQLIDFALTTVDRLRIALIDPNIPAQPVDPRDVAGAVATRVGKGGANGIEEFGGPERMSLDTALATWQEARGSRRRVVRITVPGKTGRAFRAGHLATDARPTGTITWQNWLNETYG